MAYLIDAWLDEGVPRVRICDAQTGAVRLDWIRDKKASGKCQNPDPDHEANSEVAARDALQRLFKELILLSCAAKLDCAHPWSALEISGSCIHCSACTTQL